MTQVLRMRQVNAQSGYRYLLEDIDWQVAAGEHWVVFGENGSGKTTLLSIAAGFKQPTSGSVQIFGQELSNRDILDIRRQIGWVSGSFFDRYYHRESALEIVLAQASGSLGLTAVPNAYVKRARALLRAFGLEALMDHPYDRLSKGQRQSVLIARALFLRPRLLLLDEPSAGLDVYARARLEGIVERLAADNQRAIVLVTHYVDEIPRSFDRALLLREGRIYRQGAVEALFTEPVLGDFLRHSVHLSRANGRLWLSVEAAGREEER